MSPHVDGSNNVRSPVWNWVVGGPRWRWPLIRRPGSGCATRIRAGTIGEVRGGEATGRVTVGLRRRMRDAELLTVTSGTGESRQAIARSAGSRFPKRDVREMAPTLMTWLARFRFGWPFCRYR